MWHLSTLLSHKEDDHHPIVNDRNNPVSVERIRYYRDVRYWTDVFNAVTFWV